MQAATAPLAASTARTNDGPRAVDSGEEPAPRCNAPVGIGGVGIRCPLSSSIPKGGRLSAGRLRGDAGLSWNREFWAANTPTDASTPAAQILIQLAIFISAPV